MKLIVNIPAFNEEECLEKTIKKIRQSFLVDFYSSGKGKRINEKLIQVVDDGSKDNTAQIAREHADIVISYKPNRRLAYSFKQAVASSLNHRADIMVNIDADGQFDPFDIPKLLEPILDGEIDMAIANRFGKFKAKNIPWIKDFLNRLAAKTIGFFLKYPIDDLTCGFRAHNQETLLRLNLVNTDTTYTQDTIIDAIGKNLKLKWVPVEVKYFDNRQSRVVRSVWQFVNDSMRPILRAVRDVRPLKFFAWPAVLLIGLGLIDSGYFFFNYFQDFKVTPLRNHIIFSAVTIILGIQLMIFALIADMIKSSRQLNEDLLYKIRKKELERKIEKMVERVAKN